MSDRANFYRLALILLLVLTMATNSFSQLSIKMQVPSNVPWTDTGIDVTAGSLLLIAAKGKVIYWDVNNAETDANGGNWDGTMFFPNAILPDAVVVSLIGKIGGTTDLGTGTPLRADKPKYGAGFVGKSYRAIMPESGRLFLGFNDTPNAFGDNIGSFQVSITLIKLPLRAEITPKVSDEQFPKDVGENTVNANSIISKVTATKTTTVNAAEISTEPPKMVSIGIYAGIEIQDYSNQLCGIQYCTDLANTNQWQGLTNIVPDSANFMWFDTTKMASSGQRFYRVLPGPISVP